MRLIEQREPVDPKFECELGSRGTETQRAREDAAEQTSLRARTSTTLIDSVTRSSIGRLAS